MNEINIGVSARVIDNQVGGTTRYARELYKRLANDTYNVVQLRPRAQRRNVRPGAAFAAAEMAWPRSRRDLDIIHYPADTGPVVRGKVPIVTTIHGMASRHITGVRTPVAEKAWRSRVARAAKSSARIVTGAHSAARDISEEFQVDPSRIDVIYHGIDHTKFTVEAQPNDKVIDQFGLPPNYVLYLGNLDPRKNVQRLSEAHRKACGLLSAAEKMPLVVAGKAAWGVPNLVQNLQRTSDVMYLGQVDDSCVAPLMRRATVFAFPSRYEGFGFPVIESMACGTAVLTSERGSLRELAADTAAIVDPDDTDSMATGLLQLMTSESLRDEYARRGICRAQDFVWEKSVDAHRLAFAKAMHA